MQQFWQNDDDSSDKSCVIAMVVMGFACAILSSSSRSILVAQKKSTENFRSCFKKQPSKSFQPRENPSSMYLLMLTGGGVCIKSMD